MTDEKDEYMKFQTPDEYERRKQLVLSGIANAKIRSEQKKRYIEAKSRWNRRREVTEKYDI